MPASAAAATAEVTPGTTSKATPAATRARASSPPRPRTNGSPHFSRTTRWPRRPALADRHAVGPLPLLQPLRGPDPRLDLLGNDRLQPLAQQAGQRGSAALGRHRDGHPAAAEDAPGVGARVRRVVHGVDEDPPL